LTGIRCQSVRRRYVKGVGSRFALGSLGCFIELAAGHDRVRRRRRRIADSTYAAQHRWLVERYLV
jgi:hypothetical protein